MSQATETVNMQEVIESSESASKVLLQQDGWNIVRTMHAALLDTINQTGLFVLPVMQNLDDYKLKLVDPAGFEQKFGTLTRDITAVMVAAQEIGKKSEGKTGKPDEADLVLIDSLSLDYTRLQGYIENTVQPLILVLANDLEAVGIDKLSV